MRRVIGTLALGFAMWASPATAGMLNQGAQESGASTCQAAEVNPVTGHTECIKPLGAPVEALPPSEVPPVQKTGFLMGRGDISQIADHPHRRDSDTPCWLPGSQPLVRSWRCSSLAQAARGGR